MTDSFEQLPSIAIDAHNFKEDLFFDKFFIFCKGLFWHSDFGQKY